MKKIIEIFLCGIMIICLAACGKKTNTDSTMQSTERTENISEDTVFVTQNIKRITFYAYGGSGKGSEVPTGYLDEIIFWLDTFVIEKEAPELLPPGTNTINVEIEYFDGTVVRKGLDTTTVDGITYYIKGDTAPDCYKEIIYSK